MELPMFWQTCSAEPFIKIIIESLLLPLPEYFLTLIMTYMGPRNIPMLPSTLPFPSTDTGGYPTSQAGS